MTQSVHLPTEPIAPYRALLHFDPAREGVWIGSGRVLNARCGQSEFIAVVGNPDLVDCLKCRAAIDKS